MISWIGVCGPLSAPIARMAMSRSAIMPTNLSFSPTGSTPASICAIRRAASRIVTKKIKGLHENDFIMASKIDRLLDRPAEPA